MKNIFVAFAIFISGCVSFKVDEPEVCDTHSITFPGVSFSVSAALPTIMQSFTLPTGVGKDWLSSIMLVSGSLTLQDGGSFNFLDELMISVADPKGGDDLIIWDVQTPNMDTTTLSIVATDKNLADYIDDQDNITIKITVASQTPPSTDWTINANLCVSAKVDKTIDPTNL